MNEKELKLIAFVEERNDLLAQVLSVTDGTRLTKDSAEKYVDLFEKRKILFNRIYEIDDILKDEDYNGAVAAGSAEFKNKAEQLYNTARATAYRIKEIDSANMAVTAEIKSTFMAGFKTVNEGRSIRNMYVDNSKMYDGYYFNKTK